MCLADYEIVDHLFLNCRVAQIIWRSVINWFKCYLVFPRSKLQLLEACNMGVGNCPFLPYGGPFGMKGTKDAY